MPLSWKRTSRLFGESGVWNQVQRRLIELGVIECDDRYAIGKKAKHYRLGKAWRQNGFVASKIFGKLLARLTKGNVVRAEKNASPAIEHMRTFSRLVTIPEQLVLRYTGRRFSSRKQMRTWKRVTLINLGLATLNPDCYGRAHGTIVNTRKEVRPKMQIYGEDLHELDTSCAFPLFIGYTVAKIDCGDWSIEDVVLLGIQGPFGDPFLGTPLTPWSKDVADDVIDLIRVSERGIFYQVLAGDAGYQYNEQTRGTFKKTVFRDLLFGSIKTEGALWKAFQRRWPTAALILSTLKDLGDKGTPARACQHRTEYHPRHCRGSRSGSNTRRCQSCHYTMPYS